MQARPSFFVRSTEDASQRALKRPARFAAIIQEVASIVIFMVFSLIFFKEETLPAGVVPPGPKGAQGVPLTAGRSIAVDRGSIPYGTPVWLQSAGPQTSLDKLVLAQDTGTAIVGAVRADYYAGSGTAAGELAGRLKQPLKLWVLWPK